MYSTKVLVLQKGRKKKGGHVHASTCYLGLMEMQEEGIRKAGRQYQLPDHLICNVKQVLFQTHDNGETIKGFQPMTQSTLCL